MNICPNCFQELQWNESKCKWCWNETVKLNSSISQLNTIQLDVHNSIDNMNNWKTNNHKYVEIEPNAIYDPVAKKELKWIWWWLYLLIFSIFWYLFYLLHNISEVHFNLINSWNLNKFIQFTSPNFIKYYFHSFLFEFILNITLIVLLLMCIYYFFNKARKFYLFFYLFIFINFFWILIDWVLMKLVLWDIPHQALELIKYYIITSFSIVLVRGSYVYRSKRVKNTFVEDYYNPNTLSIVICVFLIFYVYMVIYSLDFDKFFYLFKYDTLVKNFFYR